MENRLVIKVCGMKHTADRMRLEHLPVDIFGFIFHPGSPRYVGDLAREELSALTGTGKCKTGVFVDSPVAQVLRIAQMYSLDYIQAHGSESPQFCDEIRSSGLKVIKVFKVDDTFQFSAVIPFLEVSDFFLFDTKSHRPGGSGQKFNWQILENYRKSVPFFLSGGIGPEDAGVIQNLSHPALYGLDLNSGFEDAPGMKNYPEIRTFLERLNGPVV